MTAARKTNAGKAGTAKTVEAAMAAGVDHIEHGFINQDPAPIDLVEANNAGLTVTSTMAIFEDTQGPLALDLVAAELTRVMLPVAVHEGQDFALRLAGATFDGRTIAETHWMANDYGPFLRGDFCRCIARTVVDDNNLGLRILRPGYLDDIANRRRLILGGNDNRQCY